MALLAFRTAYRAERAAPKRRSPRTPILVYLGRFLGRLLPTWDAFRSFVLTVAGLSAICAGAFQWASEAGWIAVGLSLVLLEYLTAGSDR